VEEEKRVHDFLFILEPFARHNGTTMTDIKGKAKQEDDFDFDDLEFDKILNAEASLLTRESEVRLFLLDFPIYTTWTDLCTTLVGNESNRVLQTEPIRDPRIELDARFWNHR
jgi:hypothetical protein